MKRLCLLLAALAVVFLVHDDLAVAGCTADKTCPNGTVISCTGSSSCLVGLNYVDCDGRRTTCPNTSCSSTIVCPPPYQPWRLSCSSLSGPCSKTSTSVTCGSTHRTCAMCENGTITCQRLQDP
ncbi:MAG TPA: hypothetical protein VE685_16445 [Thermoanaerobaculia bacterium]|nr:hypothetical protein [Thermoanaerobaculia bacterium]